MLTKLSARPVTVSILPAFTKDRQAVEAFITEIYARIYSARIQVRYPILMSIRDQSGQILAATGFRPAASGPLFLEQYLRAPIEDILQTSRNHIVEIGNLASNGGGASLYLFAALAAYLHYKGFKQAVMTSTDHLEKRFYQMGLQPKRLAQADPTSLLNHGENWGYYYATQPHVISGSVEKGYQRLKKRLGASYQNYHHRFLPRLHYLSGE